MAVYKADILDIELNTGNIARSFLCHNIGKDDTKADRFGVRVYRDGVAESLSGCSIQGYMMRPNGTNLAITGSNTGVSGNEAWVDLPQAAYDYEGQFCLALKLIGGGVTGTVRIIDGMINNTFVSDAVAPTAAVPTYQEILSVYDQMVEAKAGSVRFDTDQTLTTAQMTQARDNIEAASESDVNDLKSAFKAEDALICSEHSLINYGYDTEYHQTEDPQGSVWYKKIGIDRVMNSIVLNKQSATDTYNMMIKLDGDVTLSGSTGSVDDWTATVPFKAGHEYVLTNKLISGSSVYDSTPDMVPSIHIYKAGTHSTLGTWETGEGIGTRTFTPGEDMICSIGVYIPKNHYVFTDARFLVIMEDKTESKIEQISGSLSSLEDDVEDLKNEPKVDLTISETLENGTNLDALSPGTYKVLNSTAAASMLPEASRPSVSYGYKLIVGYIQQTAKRFQIAIIAGISNPVMKFRFNTNDVWTEWKTVAEADEVVRVVSQNLTDGQKATARININAADASIVREMYKKIGGTTDISEQFSFADGERVNYANGKINSGTSSAASGFVDVSNYNKLTLTVPVHLSNVATGLAFYTEPDIESYDSGVQDNYDSSLQTGTYEIRTVTVPKTAKYIRVSWWATTTEQHQETDFSCTAITESKVDSEIPDYYYTNSYLQNKIASINNIAIALGNHSFQTFFVTDYHKSNNACISPRLIAQLTKETGIRNVVFGGDTITKSTASKLDGYNMVIDFLKDFRVVEANANVYYVSGNHEQNDPTGGNPSMRLPQYATKRLLNDYNSHKIVSFNYDNTNVFYVDDDVAKIRYLCIDCNYNSSIEWNARVAAFDSMTTVPEGYALFIFSHTGLESANLFDASKNYSAGSYVVYNYKVYQFTSAHNKTAWTGADVVEVTEIDGQTLIVDENGYHSIIGIYSKFADILQVAEAMNNGGSVNIHYSNTLDWSHTFTENEKRVFIGALTGHLHTDGFWIYNDHFPVITTTADTGARLATHPERAAGTVAEQAFDVVQIDVDAKRIYCTRIGFGSDRVFSFGEAGAGLVT